jgi:hypothetical protein
MCCFDNRPGSPFQPGRGDIFKVLLYTKNELEINLNLVFVPFTGI